MKHTHKVSFLFQTLKGGTPVTWLHSQYSVRVIAQVQVMKEERCILDMSALSHLYHSCDPHTVKGGVLEWAAGSAPTLQY